MSSPTPTMSQSTTNTSSASQTTPTSRATPTSTSISTPTSTASTSRSSTTRSITTPTSTPTSSASLSSSVSTTTLTSSSNTVPTLRVDDASPRDEGASTTTIISVAGTLAAVFLAIFVFIVVWIRRYRRRIRGMQHNKRYDHSTLETPPSVLNLAPHTPSIRSVHALSGANLPSTLDQSRMSERYQSWQPGFNSPVSSAQMPPAETGPYTPSHASPFPSHSQLSVHAGPYGHGSHPGSSNRNSMTSPPLPPPPTTEPLQHSPSNNTKTTHTLTAESLHEPAPITDSTTESATAPASEFGASSESTSEEPKSETAQTLLTHEELANREPTLPNLGDLMYDEEFKPTYNVSTRNSSASVLATPMPSNNTLKRLLPKGATPTRAFGHEASYHALNVPNKPAETLARYSPTHEHGTSSSNIRRASQPPGSRPLSVNYNAPIQSPHPRPQSVDVGAWLRGNTTPATESSEAITTPETTQQS